MDGRNESVKQQHDSDDEEDEDEDEEDQGEPSEPQWHSTTDPCKPLTRDR